MKARIEDDEEEHTYRAYMAESLRLQGEGKHMAERWIDIIQPKAVDTRTGDEIAFDFIMRTGLKCRGG